MSRFVIGIDQGGTFPSPLTQQSCVSLPPPRATRADGRRPPPSIWVRLVGGLVLATFLSPALARADVATPPEPKAVAQNAAPAKPDAEGFEPVKPGEVLGPGETLPATKLVAGAYGFILAAVVVWVASVALRARRVEDELAALRAKIEGRG